MFSQGVSGAKCPLVGFFDGVKRVQNAWSILVLLLISRLWIQFTGSEKKLL